MVATKAIFEKLLSQDSLAGIGNEEALNRVGVLIDLSFDFESSDGAVKALQWCEDLSKRKLSPLQFCELEYFWSNAWECQKMLGHSGGNSVWRWEQPELQREIFHLRRAVQSSGFEEVLPERQCQILTNLANKLSEVGRFTDAGIEWKRALAIDPHFGMAVGNLGIGLWHYAETLYDPGHQGVFAYFAHKSLKAALSEDAKYHGYDQHQAQKSFAATAQHIEHLFDLEKIAKNMDLDGFSLGESNAEKCYRKWVLNKGLFLNPLNDLGSYSIAAQDVLTLPSFTTDIDESPTLIGFYNQMKQEFVSGRWLLYEGLHSAETHFSDKNVLLINTLDYPSYSLAVEKIKAAYNIAYSVLDKIAYFLNDYLKLGVPQNGVYFRTIWYADQKQKKGLRREFEERENWPFRGLYWTAKDLFDPAIQEVMDPSAQALYQIRNRLAHSYLKIHEILIGRQSEISSPDPWSDRLAYSVERRDFQDKTMHLFQIARAALIELSLGMHREESQHRRGESGKLTMPMFLGRWDDEWKM